MPPTTLALAFALALWAACVRAEGNNGGGTNTSLAM